MFSQACVILFAGGGRGYGLGVYGWGCLVWGVCGLGCGSLRLCVVWGGCLVWGGSTDPPSQDRYCHGQYASYWNAFLFYKCLCGEGEWGMKVCGLYFRVWIIFQGVDPISGCGFYFRVRILFQGVDSISGCGFYFRVWIIFQGVDPISGCGFYFRVWILLQGVDSITGCRF